MEPSEPPTEQPLLEVVSWGVASGQLAIEVRNRSPWVIEQMRVRITAVDESGAVLLSTTGEPRDLCCTVVGLPPARSFGLFATVSGLSEVAAVEVEPISAELGGELPAARVMASNPRLERSADDTVAIVDLVTRHGSPRSVAVQAFLTDDSGRVGQVISARFCLSMNRREARLRLFHPVPDNLELDRVVAYALPPEVDPELPWECR